MIIPFPTGSALLKPKDTDIATPQSHFVSIS